MSAIDIAKTTKAAGGNHAAFLKQENLMPVHYSKEASAVLPQPTSTIEFNHSHGDSANGKQTKYGKSPNQPNASPVAGVVATLTLVSSSGSSSKPGPFEHGVGAATDQTPLVSALSYAEHGLPVLLAQPNTKNSYSGDSLTSAMLDPLEIQAAFSKRPDANIAVVPGLKAGVIVLDVDVKNGQPGSKVLALLNSEFAPIHTLTCLSPSGGRHLYLKHPGGAFQHTECVFRRS